MTNPSTKRGHSIEARRAELDQVLRPRVVLWSYCSGHKSGYYFYGVHTERLTNKADKQSWANEPDMRKVRSLCMDCGHSEVFFVGEDELQEHRYTLIELCNCGLPYYHESPPLSFLQQYNATPLPCRPNPNGQTDVR